MLIEYLYPNIDKNVVFHCKNIACYMIAFYAACTLYFDLDRMQLCRFLALHSLIDAPFSVKDVAIHHVVLILGVLCNIYYHIDDADTMILLDKMISTELSTIFLCNGDTINYLIEKAKEDKFGRYSKNIQKVLTVAQPINNLFFVFLFTKYRIYNYTVNVIFDDRTFTLNHINFYVYPITQWLRIINIWGLYALNIYWYNIILKKLYKLVLKDKPKKEIIRYCDMHVNIIPPIFSAIFVWNCASWLLYSIFYLDGNILTEKEVMYHITIFYTLFVMYKINSFYDRTSLIMKLLMLQYIWYCYWE